ncbi:YihY/virulence factor BrkB family protein [Arthrobacter sp. NPDC089319]|uniref:YihY/virulence factor BrkB family protein n=1 Tax=Arthrobacter sp. NPDC089319 TaxID=3155915 RepID=UPI00341F2972
MGAGTEQDTAPPPDHEDKPQTPPQVKKASWKYILRKTFREFTDDDCTDLAAGLTYYGVLSLFPGLLALVSVLGLVGQAEKTTDAMLSMVEQVAPGQALDVIRQPIEQLASSQGAGLAFVIGLVGAIWSASGYVNAFGRAMNRIYEVDEGRPFWKLRPVMLLITIVVLLLAVLMMLMLVLSGPVAQAVGSFIGLGEVALTVWNIAKWPLLVIFAVVMIAVLYYATPNVKQPKFRWMSLGALIALVVLALATLGFAFYVGNFGNYNKTYGAIGGVIVLLLWFWLANLALLFGAEFDAETERGRQLQAGIAAEENIQLPLRDSRKSDKNAEKEEEDIARGRRLRRAYGQEEKSRDHT